MDTISQRSDEVTKVSKVRVRAVSYVDRSIKWKKEEVTRT
jgi:hypothetical protein